MLVANDHRGFPLSARELLKLEAVSDKADVALVWMLEIHRPVFRLIAVVSKGTGKLELEGPVTGN